MIVRIIKYNQSYPNRLGLHRSLAAVQFVGTFSPRYQQNVGTLHARTRTQEVATGLPQMPLTDVKLRALKAKPAPYKVSDSAGLHVLVRTNGSKLWRMAYRYNGKQKTFTLGKYPHVSLLDARRARDDAKRLLLDGTDPAEDRKAQRREHVIAIGNTFEVLANEWFEVRRSGWVESYSSRLRSRMDDDLLPELGKRPIAEIKPIEVLEAIRRVERRGAVEMAKRIMQMASAIFCYAVATDRCEVDPTLESQRSVDARETRQTAGRHAGTGASDIFAQARCLRWRRDHKACDEIGRSDFCADGRASVCALV